MNKLSVWASALVCTALSACGQPADKAIVGIKTYGFVDLEGAKVSAIIVEYNQDIVASSVDAGKFSVDDYVVLLALVEALDYAVDKLLELIRKDHPEA